MNNTTKTETNEAPKTAANPFPPFPAFDPTTAWTAGQQAFQKMMTDALERANAFGQEYATLEAQLRARMQGAIANWAQLAQDAMVYSAQLSEQARKLALETARKFGATGV